MITDEQSAQCLRRDLLPTVLTHFWFKCFGVMGYAAVFFWAYIYLLKNPSSVVTVMPLTPIDEFVGFHPLALPFYLSLWVYLSMPPLFMRSRREIIEYGIWLAFVCIVALGIFYFWPSAVPPANIDWAVYPGMAFLKGVDAAGNACPSLHVATAFFSAIWLHSRLPALGFGVGARAFSLFWCAAILYSTMATKQHVAVDVAGGIILGGAVAWLRFVFERRRVNALQRPSEARRSSTSS